MHNQTEESALQLYDIYGLWHVPFWQRTWFIACALLVTCACIVLIMYVLVKKYRAKKVLVPAWQVACNHLDKLKKDQLLDPVHSERYYVALTYLLKEYISERFATDVRSLTDAQMCDYIDEHIMYDTHKEYLKQIFTAGQSIKFAHQDAVAKQMIDDWEHARAFVMASRSNSTDLDKPL